MGGESPGTARRAGLFHARNKGAEIPELFALRQSGALPRGVASAGSGRVGPRPAERYSRGRTETDTMSERQTRPSIDVRTIPPRERHPLIFSTLGALEPGDALTITSDHDPRPLHYQLETNFPGLFDWSYLEQGPQVWRVEIGRVSASGEEAHTHDDGCGCSCGGH